MNSKKIFLVWRIWDQTQKLPPKLRASILHLSSWVPEVTEGSPPGHCTAASLPGRPAEMGCRGGRRMLVSVRCWHALMTREPQSEKHSKMPRFPCGLSAQLCLVKSMNILQLISGVAATGYMVWSINCFSTHLILSTLAASLKSMVQFRYLKWVMFLSTLINWGLNEHC